ncbi:MAG: hypothetical protein HKN30_17025 [Sulfitobacter sp.]|nr:hypothetical protein [Sulfitobacter sp.]
MMDTALYVAETDELGRVVCVWHSRIGQSNVHPIQNPDKHLPQLPTATCSGASRAEIDEWMRSQSG